MAKGKKGERWSGPSIGQRSKTPPKANRKLDKAQQEYEAHQQNLEWNRRRNINSQVEHVAYVRYNCGPLVRMDENSALTIPMPYGTTATIVRESRSSTNNGSGTIPDYSVLYTIKYS